MNLKVGAGWLLLEAGPKSFFGQVVEPEEEAPEATRTPPSGVPVPVGAGPDEEEEEGIYFAPLYEVHRVWQTQGANQGLVTNLVPYGMLGDVQAKILVTQPSVISDVGDWDEGDVAMYRDLVRRAEQTRTAIRAARSGLSIVGK